MRCVANGRCIAVTFAHRARTSRRARILASGDAVVLSAPGHPRWVGVAAERPQPTGMGQAGAHAKSAVIWPGRPSRGVAPSSPCVAPSVRCGRRPRAQTETPQSVEEGGGGHFVLDSRRQQQQQPLQKHAYKRSNERSSLPRQALARPFFASVHFRKLVVRWSSARTAMGWDAAAVPRPQQAAARPAPPREITWRPLKSRLCKLSLILGRNGAGRG